MKTNLSNFQLVSIQKKNLNKGKIKKKKKKKILKLPIETENGCILALFPNFRF